MKVAKNRLKEVLAERKMKQGQLAEKVSIRREALNGISNGRQRATLYNALAIAEVLNVRIADIFYLVEVPDEE